MRKLVAGCSDSNQRFANKSSMHPRTFNLAQSLLSVLCNFYSEKPNGNLHNNLLNKYASSYADEDQLNHAQLLLLFNNKHW